MFEVLDDFLFFSSGSNEEQLSRHQVGAADLRKERPPRHWGSALPGKGKRPAAPRAADLRTGGTNGTRGPENKPPPLQLPEEFWRVQVSRLYTTLWFQSCSLVRASFFSLQISLSHG